MHFDVTHTLTSICYHVTIIDVLERNIGGKRHTVEVELSLVPLTPPNQDGSSMEVGLDIDRDSVKSCGYSREEVLTAIESGVETACVQGRRS